MADNPTTILQLRIEEGLKRTIKVEAAQKDLKIQEIVDTAVLKLVNKSSEKISFTPTLKRKGSLISLRISTKVYEKAKKAAQTKNVTIREFCYTALLKHFNIEERR